MLISGLAPLWHFPAHAEDLSQTNNGAGLVKAQPPPVSEEPKQIWDNLEHSFRALDPPPDWRKNRPSQEAIASWRTGKARLAAQLADQCRDYYRRFPNAHEAVLARESEYNLLEISVNSGNTSLIARLIALDPRELSNPSLTAQDRFDLMARIVKRNADFHQAEGNTAVMDQLEKGSRELLKAFPDNPMSWQFLVTVADEAQDPEKARRLALEIIASNADESLKISAQHVLRRLDRLGNPLPFKGIALDGRAIDLSGMNGHVVLFAFWETDCGYCLKELPEIQTAYKKFHSQGFDIISVDFDSNKNRLISFLAKEPMEWPQYFAGPDWQTTHGRIIDISGVPTLWLVDRRGNLRDLNATEDLTHKVEQLLKESPIVVSQAKK
jgi:thiol-disulfide isomerase/thioredoxin